MTASRHNLEDFPLKSLLWGCLSLDGNLSRRRLAMQIKKDAHRLGRQVSLKTIQRAFVSRAPRAEKTVKDVVLGYLNKEGYRSPAQIQKLIDRQGQTMRARERLVDTEPLARLMRLWLFVHPKKTKRILAKRLKLRLLQRGFDYDLGSIQNVLSGKAKRTRQVVVDSLKELLIREHYGDEVRLKRALAALTDTQSSLFESVPAKNIARDCRRFLKKNRGWTKRQLALKLARDLKERGYAVSPITLQYTLAGRRATARRIVAHTLASYLTDSGQKGPTKTGPVRPTGLPAPSKQQPLKTMSLKEREQALKRLWERRQRLQ